VVRGRFTYTLLGYLLIVGLLLCIALAIGGWAYWMLNHGIKVSDNAFVKWVGLTSMTVAQFGFIIRQFRGFWMDGVFGQ
jgi:hypothetical protein